MPIEIDPTKRPEPADDADIAVLNEVTQSVVEIFSAADLLTNKDTVTPDTNTPLPSPNGTASPLNETKKPA